MLIDAVIIVTIAFVGGVVGYAIGCDVTARSALRPVVREYRDETARLAKLRQADRTPVGGWRR